MFITVCIWPFYLKIILAGYKIRGSHFSSFECFNVIPHCLLHKILLSKSLIIIWASFLYNWLGLFVWILKRFIFLKKLLALRRLKSQSFTRIYLSNGCSWLIVPGTWCTLSIYSFDHIFLEKLCLVFVLFVALVFFLWNFHHITLWPVCIICREIILPLLICLIMTLYEQFYSAA